MKKKVSVRRSLCAGCGEPLYPDDVFCSYCGRARHQQQGLFCPQCGTKLPSDSSFCIQCGASLEQRIPTEARAPRKKLTRRQVVLLSVLLGLLAVLLIAGGVLLYLSRSWVSELSLSHSRLEIMRFGTAQLTCRIDPEAAAYRPITWTSSDESIATVDQNGVITAVREGTCTVTAKAQWKTVSAKITVTKPNIGMVGVSPGDLTLTAGDSFQLEYTVFPMQYRFLQPDWHSDNETVAKVDENGLVTAVGPGSCRVYADIYGKSDFINIVVYDRTQE